MHLCTYSLDCSLNFNCNQYPLWGGRRTILSRFMAILHYIYIVKPLYKNIFVVPEMCSCNGVSTILLY